MPFAGVILALPATLYLNRATVTTRGSTHVGSAFMGLTSPGDVTVCRTLPAGSQAAHRFSAAGVG